MSIDPAGDLFLVGGGGYQQSRQSVVELPAGASTATSLATLPVAPGEDPQGTLVEDARGDLFGVTTDGGTAGAGAIYEVPAGSAQPVLLASMQPVVGELGPNSLTIDAAGDLFGTTGAYTNGDVPDGSYDYGGVFELPAGSTTVRVLAAFQGFDGYAPRTPITIDAAGDLFLTTGTGGAFGEGSILERPAGASAFNVLTSFDASHGEYPGGSLAFDAAGDLFGTCQYGGVGPSFYQGVIYELPKGATQVVDLHTFKLNDATYGCEPYTGLTADANGNLYGSTRSGGSTGDGTLFRFVPGTKTLTTLASTDSGSLGEQVDGPLVLDATGNLFGVTAYGVGQGPATVFEITGGRTVTTIATLPTADGTPEGLLLDPAGQLYTAQRYGPTGGGEVVAIVPTRPRGVHAGAVLGDGRRHAHANRPCHCGERVGGGGSPGRVSHAFHREWSGRRDAGRHDDRQGRERRRHVREPDLQHARHVRAVRH